MPYSYVPALYELYPRKWEKLLKQITTELVKQGWCIHAKKFDQVLMRKAKRLFTVKYCQ